jgi:hypothetical protein
MASAAPRPAAVPPDEVFRIRWDAHIPGTQRKALSSPAVGAAANVCGSRALRVPASSLFHPLRNSHVYEQITGEIVSNANTWVPPFPFARTFALESPTTFSPANSGNEEALAPNLKPRWPRIFGGYLTAITRFIERYNLPARLPVRLASWEYRTSGEPRSRPIEDDARLSPSACSGRRGRGKRVVPVTEASLPELTFVPPPPWSHAAGHREHRAAHSACRVDIRRRNWRRVARASAATQRARDGGYRGVGRGSLRRVSAQRCFV